MYHTPRIKNIEYKADLLYIRHYHGLWLHHSNIAHVLQKVLQCELMRLLYACSFNENINSMATIVLKMAFLPK